MGQSGKDTDREQMSKLYTMFENQCYEEKQIVQGYGEVAVLKGLSQKTPLRR